MSMRELARLASTKNKQSMNEYFLLCFLFLYRMYALSAIIGYFFHIWLSQREVFLKGNASLRLIGLMSNYFKS